MQDFIIDIIRSSISSYILSIPITILYFLYLNRFGKKQTKTHICFTLLLCYVVIGILTATGINSINGFSPRIVIIPFLDMIRGPIDTILNIILFIPFGTLLPILYRKCIDWRKTILVGFLFSLSIEILQMYGTGITDINDLITNTLGTYFGYHIYKLTSIKIRNPQKYYTNHISDFKEILFIILHSFIVMTIIQPTILG